MKDVLITRLVDPNNRIVLPTNLITEVLHLQNEEEKRVDLFVDGDSIVIKNHKPICVFCRTHNNLSKFKHTHICSECLRELCESQK